MAGGLVTETTRERARAEWADFMSSPRGWGLTTLVTVLGVVVALLMVPDEWSDVEKGTVTTIAGAGAGAFFVFGVLVGLFFVSPKWQRDEARGHLRRMKDARESYRIVPSDPTLVDVLGSHMRAQQHLYVPISNKGRGAQFAVMIDGIDGAEEELVDPSARLFWADRPGVEVDEIPFDDVRRIGVGVITESAGGWRFIPMSTDGPRPTSARNYLLAQPGTTTFRLRVSARNDPKIHYTRRFAVSINCPGGPGTPFTAHRAPDPLNAEETQSFETLEELFDYDV